MLIRPTFSRKYYKPSFSIMQLKGLALMIVMIRPKSSCKLKFLHSGAYIESYTIKIVLINYVLRQIQ